MSVCVILVCGGSGTRMGSEQNKTLLTVGGVPSCVRAARTLLKVADSLVAVVRAGEEENFTDIFAKHGLRDAVIVTGGNTRQESVRHGLDAVPDDCTEVLVHDGARPLVGVETACVNTVQASQRCR